MEPSRTLSQVHNKLSVFCICVVNRYQQLSGGVSYTELTLPRQQKDAAMQLQVRVVLKLHSDSYVIKVQTLYQVKFSC